MNRSLLVIIGIILVVVLLGVWVYVLFFSTPKESSDNFSNLELGDTTDTTIATENNDPEPEAPVVEVGDESSLHQLTLTPVIGHQEVMSTPSSTPEVYYVEPGTGHVFSIDANTGEERKITITTIQDAHKAAITTNGKYIMVQSGTGAHTEHLVGEFSSSSDSLNTGVIDGLVTDFTTTVDNTFLYAVATQNSLLGKEYIPSSNTIKTLFTIPFREAVVVWGKTADSIHYAYPKANSQLKGFLYEIDGDTLSRLPIAGYGLTAVGAEQGIVFSQTTDDYYEASLYSKSTDQTGLLSVSIIPEKCAVFNKETTAVICASQYVYDEKTALPDEWYQGTLQSIDNLWKLDLVNMSLGGVVNLAETSGREIDVVSPEVSQDDERLYFINKNDGTLWLYNIVPQDANIN